MSGKTPAVMDYLASILKGPVPCAWRGASLKLEGDRLSGTIRLDASHALIFPAEGR